MHDPRVTHARPQHKHYQEMLGMRQQRMTYSQIAKEFHITNQAVQQILGGGRLPKIVKERVRYKTILERFWNFVDIKEEDDCWEWKRSRYPSGYGHIGISGYSHRTAYELTNGKIPEGMCVCHHCDNPPCCNPKHLFLGTQLDNVQDMLKKNRRRKGVSDK